MESPQFWCQKGEGRGFGHWWPSQKTVTSAGAYQNIYRTFIRRPNKLQSMCKWLQVLVLAKMYRNKVNKQTFVRTDMSKRFIMILTADVNAPVDCAWTLFSNPYMQGLFSNSVWRNQPLHGDATALVVLCIFLNEIQHLKKADKQHS